MSIPEPTDSFYEPPEQPEPPAGMKCKDCLNCSEAPDGKSAYGWCEYSQEWVLLEEYVSNLDCEWEL